MRACSAFIILLVTVPLTACGKPDAATKSLAPSNTAPASGETATTDPAQPATAIVPATTEIKKVDAAGFTLGDYLPPLDGARIEIAPPADWNPMPRDSKYVVRFYEESRNSLPRIDVTVDENSLGTDTSITEANLAEFTVAVAKDLEANGTSVLEPPLPMVIGAVPCVRYVSRLKLKIGEGTILVERQTLELQHTGRRYKINLLVMPDKLSDSRDAAYAVCSGVRFLEVEQPAETE